MHSYAFEADNTDDVICTADYEKTITAGILRNNIFGTQFHPEKSQDNGVKLLSNFNKFSKATPVQFLYFIE